MIPTVHPPKWRSILKMVGNNRIYLNLHSLWADRKTAYSRLTSSSLEIHCFESRCWSVHRQRFQTVTSFDKTFVDNNHRLALLQWYGNGSAVRRFLTIKENDNIWPKYFSRIDPMSTQRPLITNRRNDMDIGVGLDANLNLSLDEQAQ